jgi:hypothetical protein
MLQVFSRGTRRPSRGVEGPSFRRMLQVVDCSQCSSQSGFVPWCVYVGGDARVGSGGVCGGGEWLEVGGVLHGLKL